MSRIDSFFFLSSKMQQSLENQFNCSFNFNPEVTQKWAVSGSTRRRPQKTPNKSTCFIMFLFGKGDQVSKLGYLWFSFFGSLGIWNFIQTLATLQEWSKGHADRPERLLRCPHETAVLLGRGSPESIVYLAFPGWLRRWHHFPSFSPSEFKSMIAAKRTESSKSELYT